VANPKTLFSKLLYRGPVKSLRRDYHVLEGSHHYVLVSASTKSSGNYSIIHKDSLDFLTKKMGRRRLVTSADVWEACKRSKLLRERFTVLNALYVLVGINAASIAKHRKPLVFNLRKKV
jgi:hypothetical protein